VAEEYTADQEVASSASLQPIIYVGGGLEPIQSFGLGNYWALIFGVSTEGAIIVKNVADPYIEDIEPAGFAE